MPYLLHYYINSVKRKCILLHNIQQKRRKSKVLEVLKKKKSKKENNESFTCEIRKSKNNTK